MRKALEGASAAEIQSTAQELSDAMQRLGAAVYGQGSPPQAGQSGGGKSGDAGTVEGEFREV